MHNAQNDQHEEPVEFIRLPKVLALVGLSQTTVYEMARKGEFPKQVRLGGNSVAWVKSEVLQWSREKLAARDQGNQASSPSK
ncbi:AlpA family transcriptional regulator [Pseudomonas mandelii]|uniref:AlpA family transcriptional regulator n=2 Tax=Pseudomonas mandelii TaxID=75612 RepID=A0AB36CZ57_9PSED|nr:AlpA family transcriptional regulator [Pseudomonas mandelii]